MTAKQLSMILSGLNDNNIVIKLDNKEYSIKTIELGLNNDIGKVIINIE